MTDLPEAERTSAEGDSARLQSTSAEGDSARLQSTSAESARKTAPATEAITPMPRARLRNDYQGALGRVAHDIRSATGVAWTALTEIERSTVRTDGQPSGLESYLRIGQRSLRRLLLLADRLTLAGTIEQGELELASSQTRVAELIRSVVDDVSFALGRRSVEVTLEAPDTALAVTADGRWISAALAELIGNAIRFAKSRVKIHAEASSSDPAFIDICIQDDGPGLPETARASLIDGSPTPDGAHGLGLSLPLAHRVVLAHAGRIRIDAPDAGQGTIVVVTLPRARTDRSSSP